MIFLEQFESLVLFANDDVGSLHARASVANYGRGIETIKSYSMQITTTPAPLIPPQEDLSPMVRSLDVVNDSMSTVEVFIRTVKASGEAVVPGAVLLPGQSLVYSNGVRGVLSKGNPDWAEMMLRNYGVGSMYQDNDRPDLPTILWITDEQPVNAENGDVWLEPI